MIPLEKYFMRDSEAELTKDLRRDAETLVARGLEAEGAGCTNEAADLYRQAISLNPRSAPAHINLGILLQTEGDRTGAISSYRQAIESDPASAPAQYNLGSALSEAGESTLAESAYREAIRLRPSFPEAWVGLAHVLEALGRYEDALAALESAIGQREHFAGAQMNASLLLRKMGRLVESEEKLRAIDLGALVPFPDRHAELESVARQMVDLWPGYVLGWRALGAVLALQKRYEEAVPALESSLSVAPDTQALLTLGGALEATGRLSEAERSYRKAIELQPDDPEMHNILGAFFQQQQRPLEAKAVYEEALRLKPDFVAAHNNLGNALKDLRRFHEAEANYRRATELDPRLHQAHNNLGIVLHEVGRLAEAEESCRRAIELAPAYRDAHYSLGVALQSAGKSSEAEASFRAALELDPANYLTFSSLGVVLQSLGRPSEAESSYRCALELEPDSHIVHGNLGVPLNSLGRVAEAQLSFRRSLAGDPDLRDVRSNLLLSLNYTNDLSHMDLFHEHLEWSRRHESLPVRASRPHANDPNPHRKLRVGYVSPDFRRHSVAFFVEPLLRCHSRDAVAVHCYSNVLTHDGVTAHLASLADTFRDIAHLNDDEAAKLVRDDGIDILVDLAGHTARGRLGLFALGPAPVQVTYLGYPNTTGLAAVDWRLTDSRADPVGEGDEFYSEKLMRLPRTFLCFQPPVDAPDVLPPPSLKTGHVTFGSFNTLPKLTAEVIAVWSRLLKRAPGSRLVLKASGLDDSQTRARLIHEFEMAGVNGDRLSLLPKTGDFNEHLSCYHQIDVGLDPFPYNGTTTTCEALWMGVPTVTLSGNRHASRVGASILANLGLPELIAASVEGYIEAAGHLAADQTRLSALRRTMRDRFSASPLRDETGFAEDVERAYRKMWADWCR